MWDGAKVPGPRGPRSLLAQFGAEDRGLLYAAAGVGVVPAGPVGFWSAGGGMAFGLGSNFDVFTEARAIGAFGGGGVGTAITFGFNFHP